MLAIREHQLANGIRAIFVERPGLHSLSLTYFLGGGSNEERPEKNGLTHLLEHMLFTRTKHFSSSQALTRSVEAIGGSFNATTRKEEVEIYVTCHPSQAKRGLRILHDATFRPEFRASQLARERNVVAEELLGRKDDPSTQFGEFAAEVLYAGSPHAQSVGGTLALVQSMTLRDLRERYGELLRKERVVFVAAGAFETDALLRMLEEESRDVRLGPKHVPSADAMPTAPRFGHRKADVQQAWLLWSLPTIPDTDPAWPQLHILLDILSARLFHTAREKHGLVYGIWTDASASRTSGRIELGSRLDAKNLPALLRDIRAELRALTAHPVKGVELRNYVRRSHYGLDYMHDSVSRLADWFAWQRLQHPTRALRTPYESDRIIRQTTTHDLLALARKLLRPSRAGVVTMAGIPLHPRQIARALH